MYCYDVCLCGHVYTVQGDVSVTLAGARLNFVSII